MMRKFCFFVLTVQIYIDLCFYVNGLDLVENDCGKPYIQPNVFEKEVGQDERILKIIRGKNAIPFSFPWMVSIRRSYKDSIGPHFCGGTLISNEYVITAGHCVYSKRLSSIVIVLGVHNIRQELAHSNIYNISKIFLHENYQDTSKNNDIALIKLATPVEFSPNVLPICLPHDEFDSNFQKAVLIGWGSIYGANEESNLASDLQQTVLKIHEDSFCLGNLPIFRPGKMFCALDNSKKLYSNACFGDSGGPLLISINNRWFIYGISSLALAFQNYTCNPFEPSYYTKVNYYLDWINQKINP